MSETKIDVEIDNETGLPSLPEGYFWRIGTRHEYDDPRIQIVSRGIVTKYKGNGFFRDLFGLGPKEYQEEDDIIHLTDTLWGAQEERKEDIPEGATDVAYNAANVYNDAYYFFLLPKNEVGISYLAKKMYIRWSKIVKGELDAARRREEAAAFGEKFFGDYPPKKLK